MTAVQSCGATTALMFTLVGIAKAKARAAGDKLNHGVALLCVLCAIMGLVRAGTPGIAVVAAISCAAVCAATDISSGFIYDSLIGLSGAIICVASIAEGTLPQACLGAAVAVTLSGALYLLTAARGLGLGDVKLFAVAGAAVWGEEFLVIFGASFVFGAAIALAGLATRRLTLPQRVPFAPYIAAAMIGTAAMHWRR